MVIKKKYDDNDYIIMNVTNEYTLNGLVVLQGKCIECVDPDGAIYNKGDDCEVFASDLIEVLEP